MAGSYISSSLGPDERILHVARFHWWYTVSALGWVIVSILVSWLLLERITAPAARAFLDFPLIGPLGDHGQVKYLIAIGFCGFAGLQYAWAMMRKYTTEIAVTNMRLIYKTGWFSRHVQSINVNRIEGADMRQSVLGRAMNFGTVNIRGTGVGGVQMPPIAEPITFRQALIYAASGRA